jgi:hypothetical protein
MLSSMSENRGEIVSRRSFGRACALSNDYPDDFVRVAKFASSRALVVAETRTHRR